MIKSEISFEFALIEYKECLIILEHLVPFLKRTRFDFMSDMLIVSRLSEVCDSSTWLSAFHHPTKVTKESNSLAGSILLSLLGG